MGDRVQPRCVDCDAPLAAPSPHEYLELLAVVRERIALSDVADVRAEDVLRPYQDIVRAGIELHRSYCPQNLAAAGASARPGLADDNGRAALLTAREEEVLALMLAGASSREIAERLFISPHTVAFHVKRLMRKFDVHSKVALVAKAAAELRSAGPPPVTAAPEAQR